MKRVLIILFAFLALRGQAQSSNDILNILVANKSISQEQADSIRAESAINQQTTVPEKKLTIEFEYRPRAEYRNGYQVLRNDSSSAAVFANQRSRLSLNYTYDNRFILQFSVQDLRVWGQQDPRYTGATLQVFEAWAEPYLTDKLSLRIGRQRIMYDNQRLFAENDWRLSAAVHDAVNLRYYGQNLSSELAFAFNQTSERLLGTDYSPVGFTNYKFLAVHYLKYNFSKTTILTLLNSTDGFQKKTDTEKMNFRYTLGGRIEGTIGSVYATMSAYYQGGRNSSGKELQAYYLQPEIRFTYGTSLTVRAGMEYFSGGGNKAGMNIDKSFVPLYGVAHRFNGSMDLITKFPGDVGGSGLINPYLFLIKPLNPKFEVRSDFHTFHLQNNYYVNDVAIDKYLGFENDWLLTYKPNPVTKIDIGFSYMVPTETLETIKAAGSSKYNLSWFFISMTFKPVLFTTKFK
ncbi:MAG: alginate export family protein [Bacteroidales bacterium]